MVKKSCVKASVSSEKYTPRRRMTRKPTATPVSAARVVPRRMGTVKAPLKTWSCARVAPYIPIPKNIPCPKDRRPV